MGGGHLGNGKEGRVSGEGKGSIDSDSDVCQGWASGGAQMKLEGDK